MGRVRVPKLKLRAPRHRAPANRDPLEPGRHTVARQGKPPSDRVAAGTRIQPPAPRTRQKSASGGARAQLEQRATQRPPRAYGQRVTPLENRPDKLGNRNWPAPRQRSAEATPAATRAARAAKTPVSTREQLARRGGPAKPHPRSGDMARSDVKARGVAKRPASALRNPHATNSEPTPVPRQRRHPDTSGRTFASGFFGRPPGAN